MVTKAAGKPCCLWTITVASKGKVTLICLILALRLLSQKVCLCMHAQRISGWFHIHIDEDKTRFGCSD